MEQKGYNSDESDYESSSISKAAEAITAPFRALISKQAQRAYLGTLLFVITSFFLLAAAAVAYWVFYFNYVPQIGLERVVHLQFGAENPWGTAFLGSELASLQPYDVSVTLQLPRTPANLAAGNFMLDLAFLSRPQSSIMGTNSSTSVITHSRRPAILTYASPLVDTAHKISRMPLYLVGWQREAETLEVKMMESVEFARGWRNVPGSLRFEMQSQEQMQVYSAIVKFKAKFTGLRWMMYNWRFLSFFIFASMFWSVSMVSTSIAFLLFSSYLGHGDHEEDKPVKKEEPLEQSEGEQEPSNDMFSTAFSTLTHQRKMGTPVRTKSEEAGIIKEEVLEETTAIPPLRGQTLEGEADDEAEDVELVRAGGDYTDSGIGTSVESGSVRVVQRRRSRPFASRDDDN